LRPINKADRFISKTAGKSVKSVDKSVQPDFGLSNLKNKKINQFFFSVFIFFAQNQLVYESTCFVFSSFLLVFGRSKSWMDQKAIS
jgi:hypothetical protein